MWLLSTDRAEVHYFSRNFDATGGYAILSHTWDGKEQTLQEVKAITEQCRQNGTNPRDFVHSKIRNCCIIAEKHGYRWVWIDSCCIDKTSSSELSEAINSMYKWYREAEVCFAYLADVPSDCVLHAPDSAFRRSRWHTRGWTLQELIAPDILIFLSTDWRKLGNRADLAELLQQITRVQSWVLTGRITPAQVSVSIRMHWASKRKTTRVEDEAYSLMGLFGVSMPTNYGEGKGAFIWLQYEIMQHYSDMTLFAFGYRTGQDYSLTLRPEAGTNSRLLDLMANSPCDFTYAYLNTLHATNAEKPYPPPHDSQFTGPFDGGVELPRLSVTNYGIKLRLPVYEDDGITIAVIFCQRDQNNYGLFLTRDIQGKDPKRPRYFTGCIFTKPDTGSKKFTARMANLGNDLYNLTFNGKPVKASWRTIHVVPTTSELDLRSLTTPDLFINRQPTSHFHIPRWLVARLTDLRFSVCQLEHTNMLQAIEIFNPFDAQILVSFGSCTERHSDNSNLNNPVQLWVKVAINTSEYNEPSDAHDCSEDHLDSKSWAAHSKFFGNVDRGVQLSLTPSPHISDGLFIVHLELHGRIFQEMLKERGAPLMFPSLVDLERETPHLAPNDPTPPSQPSTLQIEPAFQGLPIQDQNCGAPKERVRTNKGGLMDLEGAEHIVKDLDHQTKQGQEKKSRGISKRWWKVWRREKVH